MPSYDDIETHEGLVQYSQKYLTRVAKEYSYDIDWTLVSWRVSKRMTRTAAHVEAMSHDRFSTRVPIKQDVVRDEFDEEIDDDSKFDSYLECEVVLAWKAFDAYDEAEWQRTLRHELIHIYQQQRYCDSNHQSGFKVEADRLSTTETCPEFTPPNWIVRCGECGQVVAKRHKKSKLIKQPNKYQSNCCESPVQVKQNNLQ